LQELLYPEEDCGVKQYSWENTAAEILTKGLSPSNLKALLQQIGSPLKDALAECRKIVLEPVKLVQYLQSLLDALLVGLHLGVDYSSTVQPGVGYYRSEGLLVRADLAG